MLNISCFNFVIPAVCVVLGHLMAELPSMYIAVQYRPNQVKTRPYICDCVNSGNWKIIGIGTVSS